MKEAPDFGSLVDEVRHRPISGGAESLRDQHQRLHLTERAVSDRSVMLELVLARASLAFGDVGGD